MNIEQKKFVDILVWIAQLGDNVQNLPEEAQKIHQSAAGKYRKINSRELEAILTQGESKTLSLLDSNAFIYLPPVTKGGCFVPILCVEYDFDAETPIISLKVALFLMVEKDGKDSPQAIGYRFETPHHQGRHHYYHIQPIDGFGRSSRWKLPGTEWIPTDYPAFPIDAHDPIELLVCLLVSLYDLAIINNLEGKFKTLIKSNIRGMKLSRFITRLLHLKN